jgi:uncharacterized membrane protein YtjA (UPF0391 family)
MLYSAVTFFIVALVLGGLELFGITAGAGLAKILFFELVALAVASLVIGQLVPAEDR